jgi:hypothetical protein
MTCSRIASNVMTATPLETSTLGYRLPCHKCVLKESAIEAKGYKKASSRPSPRKIPLGAPQLAVGRKAGQPVGLLQSWYGLQNKRPCRL